MATVSAALKKELLALRKEDLTVNFLVSKLSKTTSAATGPDGKKKFEVKPPAWDTKAKLHLMPGDYTNTVEIDTTLGSFIFNKLMIEDNLDSIIPGGYFNEVVTAKSFGKLVNIVASALMDKKVPIQPNVVRFLQAFEFYGLMLCSALSPSMTKGVLSVDPEVKAARDKMYEDAGEDLDITKAVQIEDDLVKMARKKMKKDPGMTLFDSGSRGSFEDNYKNMSITIGPVKNPATGKYDIIQSSYIDGAKKKDLPALANTIVNAAYPKAIGTAEGGYITKQFYAVFQSIQIDERGTDCGSRGYLPVFITPSNFPDYMWQYAAVNGKLVLLENDNRDQFMNKVVYLRSPLGCLSPKICSKCMGERFYILGINNAGLTAGRLPNAIMNANMKAFHKTKVELYGVDPNKLLLD